MSGKVLRALCIKGLSAKPLSFNVQRAYMHQAYASKPLYCNVHQALLSKPRVALAQLYQRSGSECVLSVVVHHIAVDLWSLVVLIREFFERYRLLKETGSQPAPRDIAVEYVDYSEWERRLLADPASDEMLRYWMQVCASAWPDPEYRKSHAEKW
jgi:hypothetical protein